MGMDIITGPTDTVPGQKVESRLKMHLRLLTIRGATYRVVTLRPSTRGAFSTNFFHETWHLVTSLQGSRLLARLFWGLAFQRQPGTLLLIHGAHLQPTPFEAERSDPFLIVPAGITGVDAARLRCLKSRLPHLGPPSTTICWQTFGLDVALGRAEADSTRHPWAESQQLRQQEKMSRTGGFIVYQAPPAILRRQALRIHGLHVSQGDPVYGMDYHFLAESSSKDSWYGDGEVQIFADYQERVAAATIARNELLANPNQPVLCESMQEFISQRRDQIKARRRVNCRARVRWFAK
jgi:hypothetical protein